MVPTIGVVPNSNHSHHLSIRPILSLSKKRREKKRKEEKRKEEKRREEKRREKRREEKRRVSDFRVFIIIINISFCVGNHGGENRTKKRKKRRRIFPPRRVHHYGTNGLPRSSHHVERTTMGQTAFQDPPTT